jgi:cytosine/adenosine deaminase-related metal-dependent hydrolase
MNNRRIKNALMCQFVQGDFVPIFGDIIIEDELIREIKQTSYADFLKNPIIPKMIGSDEGDDGEYDAQGRMVLPPLTNFHEHIYSRLSKGLPVTGKMDDFVEILENLWWKLDRTLSEQAVEVSAELAAIEAIKNGVLTLFDHHSSPDFINDSENIIKKVLKTRELNAVLSYEVSDRNGVENMKQAAEENISFIKYRTTADFKGQFGLHALFTLSDETLKYIQDETRDLGCGYHIHAAEDIFDAQFSEEKYGITICERLEKFNMLNKLTFLAHGNHLVGKDLDLILKHNSSLIHNPDSNFNNAVGTLNIANVPKEIPLLLGTDGMHCNMLKTIKMAFLTCRHINKTSVIGFDIVDRILKNSFEIHDRFFGTTPRLRKGDSADFIVLDYCPYTPIDKDNFLGHFLYGACETQVKSVVKKGHFLMKDFVVDPEEEVYKKAYNVSQEIREKFQFLQNEER